MSFVKKNDNKENNAAIIFQVRKKSKKINNWQTM